MAELRNGALSGLEVDVLEARCCTTGLSEVGHLTAAAHMRDRQRAAKPRAEVYPTFGAVLTRHVLRRIVATIRAAQHRGTLIMVPASRVPELLVDGSNVRVKYSFTDEEPAGAS